MCVCVCVCVCVSVCFSLCVFCVCVCVCKQWMTEQLGGNFSWCFNFSRGWIIHKGNPQKSAYSRSLLTL